MQTRSKAAPRAARMIAWTAAAALGCWGATLAMLRAVAQDAAPPPAPSVPSTPAGQPPPADGPDTNEEEPGGRARAPAPAEELPEYRDSADNNISLPVDI